MQSTLDKNLVLVCQFCDVAVNNIFCYSCNEYKGIMTLAQWEEYTGEEWEV
jgi:hypothetical protein